MTIQMFGRLGAALALAASVSGCSLIGLGDSARGGNCEAAPKECAYKPGEKEFAEEEAKRLNKASAEKLRRSSGR